jgi:hypothetical protein
MKKFSTRDAAAKLGLSPIALSRYVARGKVPAPEIVTLGRSTFHVWTEAQIETVRKLLPKIANGRKTRYQKPSQKKQTKKQSKP